jgi:hypothetical protein
LLRPGIVSACLSGRKEAHLAGFGSDPGPLPDHDDSTPAPPRSNKRRGGLEGMMGQFSAVVLLHLRRLDGFLRRHGLRSTAHTYVRPHRSLQISSINSPGILSSILRLERESLAFFDAAHLQKLVRKGRWDAAWRYVRRFSPLFPEEGGEGPSHHYTAFVRTLGHHAMLDYLACRGDEAAKSLYPRPPMTPSVTSSLRCPSRLTSTAPWHHHKPGKLKPWPCPPPIPSLMPLD